MGKPFEINYETCYYRSLQSLIMDKPLFDNDTTINREKERKTYAIYHLQSFYQIYNVITVQFCSIAIEN